MDHSVEILYIVFVYKLNSLFFIDHMACRRSIKRSAEKMRTVFVVVMLVMMMSSCMATSRSLNNYEQQPAGGGGTRTVDNHHHMDRDKFNDKYGGGGASPINDETDDGKV